MYAEISARYGLVATIGLFVAPEVEIQVVDLKVPNANPT